MAILHVDRVRCYPRRRRADFSWAMRSALDLLPIGVVPTQRGWAALGGASRRIHRGVKIGEPKTLAHAEMQRRNEAARSALRVGRSGACQSHRFGRANHIKKAARVLRLLQRCRDLVKNWYQSLWPGSPRRRESEKCHRLEIGLPHIFIGRERPPGRRKPVGSDFRNATQRRSSR